MRILSENKLPQRHSMKASISRVGNQRFAPKSSYISNLKICTLVAAVPDAWCYEVISRFG